MLDGIWHACTDQGAMQEKNDIDCQTLTIKVFKANEDKHLRVLSAVNITSEHSWEHLSFQK